MGLIPGLGRSLEEGMKNHSSILTWRIPWREEPDGLQYMGSQRVGHDWGDLAHTHEPVCFENKLGRLNNGGYGIFWHEDLAEIYFW